MRRLALPSFPDLLFAALLAVLLVRGGGLAMLLSDGDTGWHIRTGEWILRSGAVPREDLFSFSRPHAPWTAWEWLSDVLFARWFVWGGLTAVTAACACLLCLAAAILCAWLLERGAGLWLAAAVTLLVSNASTVHYLARPHIFTILLFTAGLWVVDRDRRSPGRWLWLLPLLTALWCNMHGGFFLWLAVLWLLPAAAALEGGRWRRYTGLAGACSAATLINPYGWNLHRHILDYLNSSWILGQVQEFQPPEIRSENLLIFAMLLVAGVALAARAAGGRRWFEPLLVWLLALAALRSARHVPLYAIASAPVIAGECAAWWREAAARRGDRSPLSILWTMGQQLSERRSVTFWTPALGVLVLALLPSPVTDFPRARFPAQAVTAMDGVLAPCGSTPRILTSDQWGDYLIFRLYPRQRVFFDGRSDFYGEALGADYQALLGATARARDVLDRYRFDAALLPNDWPLERVLERDTAWQRVYQDRVAALFIRPVQQNRQWAEMKK